MIDNRSRVENIVANHNAPNSVRYCQCLRHIFRRRSVVVPGVRPPHGVFWKTGLCQANVSISECWCYKNTNSVTRNCYSTPPQEFETMFSHFLPVWMFETSPCERGLSEGGGGIHYTRHRPRTTLQAQKWTELVTNKSLCEQELLTLSELEDSSISKSSDGRDQKWKIFR